MSTQHRYVTAWVDTHAHVYPELCGGQWIESVFGNFKDRFSTTTAPDDPRDHVFALFLLATARQPDFRERWRRSLPSAYDLSDANGGYMVDGPLGRLYVVEGRQWQTHNKLELVTLGNVDLKDGISLHEMASTLPGDYIGILPWGVGKWLGKRGQEVREVFEEFQSRIWLGDNGNRPRLWHTVSLFEHARKLGKPVLLGSDPLPLMSDFSRIGTVGMTLNVEVDSKELPASLVATIFGGRAPMKTFGSPMGLSQFVTNQTAIMLR